MGEECWCLGVALGVGEERRGGLGESWVYGVSVKGSHISVE